MNIDERIASLVASTARGTAKEQELLRERVIEIGSAITGTSVNTTAPPLVVLETRETAFFKRFSDQKPALCRLYNQDRLSAVLNEVIAWRLAYAMGDPWRQLVPTAVLRKIDGLGGALVRDRRGKNDPAAYLEAASQVMAAGFWDALIGNQDRNTRNYRYESAPKRLALIDHGFVFARPGDPLNPNAAAFFAYRRRQPTGQVLTAHELATIEALVDSGNLHGLRQFLPADRADALETRARTMLQSNVLPTVGTF
jgi:hypothetical protein